MVCKDEKIIIYALKDNPNDQNDNVNVFKEKDGSRRT